MNVEQGSSAEEDRHLDTASGTFRAVPIVWALVLLGTLAPPLAISCGFWLFYRTVARLDAGSAGDYEMLTSWVATIVVVVGTALVVQAGVGAAFLVWLHRARVNSEVLSHARHRYGPGWAVGAWFVPIAKLVLPRVIVADILRASTPDGPPALGTVNAWWIATLLARTTHRAAWVIGVLTFVDLISPSGFLTAAVVHTVGTLCSGVVAALLGEIVIDVTDGQRYLAAQAPEPTDDESFDVDGEPSCSPSVPAPRRLEFNGLGSWFGFSFSSIQRSAAPLLVLATVASAVSAVDLLTQLPSVQSSETGIWFGSTGYGIGPARHLLIGGADWSSQFTALISYVVVAVASSAAMVVVVRLASRDLASVLAGLRIAIRRIHALLGWIVVAVAMAMVGLLFLVIPGVYTLIVIAMTLIAVVTLEERGILRCFELVRGRFWPTAARFVVMILLSQTWWFIAYGIAFQIVEQPLASVILYTVLGPPAFVFGIGSLSATYVELRFYEDRRAETSQEPAWAPISPLRTSTRTVNSDPAVRAAEAQDEPATSTDPATQQPHDIGTGSAGWSVAFGMVAPSIAVSGVLWWVQSNGMRWETDASTVSTVVSALPTIVAIVAVATFVQGVAGLMFVWWLYRARTTAETFPGARHRLDRWWVIAGWLIPLVNLVVPNIVMADVMRVSCPGQPRSGMVAAWWTATVLSRLAHFVGWVIVIAAFLGFGSPTKFLAGAVVHLIGSLCSVAAGLLLGVLIPAVTEAQQHPLRRGDVGKAIDPPTPRPMQPAAGGGTDSTPRDSAAASTADGLSAVPPGEHYGPRRGGSPVYGLVWLTLVVVAVLATVGLSVTAQGNNRAVTATPPPGGGPTPAEILAPIVAKTRSDGSGTFTATIPDGLKTEFPVSGRFHYGGDRVSVQAELHPDHPYLHDIIVIDDQSWLEVEYPEPNGRWERCRDGDTQLSMECSKFPLWAQDFADPAQLLSRAGNAVTLLSTEQAAFQGRAVTRYGFKLDRAKALTAETDPHWKERFKVNWLSANNVYLWVDQDHRVLQMVLGTLSPGDPDDVIVYENWGSAGPITAPSGN